MSPLFALMIAFCSIISSRHLIVGCINSVQQRQFPELSRGFRITVIPDSKQVDTARSKHTDELDRAVPDTELDTARSRHTQNLIPLFPDTHRNLIPPVQTHTGIRYFQFQKHTEESDTVPDTQTNWILHVPDIHIIGYVQLQAPGGIQIPPVANTEMIWIPPVTDTQLCNGRSEQAPSAIAQDPITSLSNALPSSLITRSTSIPGVLFRITLQWAAAQEQATPAIAQHPNMSTVTLSSSLTARDTSIHRGVLFRIDLQWTSEEAPPAITQMQSPAVYRLNRHCQHGEFQTHRGIGIFGVTLSDAQEEAYQPLHNT
ncbi:hypothetical protein AVEN_107585-1 [Araneus ventricosus]|uniref:Uncharacterized protein n=1 Tax=Araneus ventricosus TaxID=182803 RepID=A0A4Y2TBJ5_ARAVE|nr:hypothetical protein AVEN_107585-1 [Araneus ventricosus]